MSNKVITYLSGELLELSLDGEILLHHNRMIGLAPLQDLVDRKTLVVGNVELFDLRAFD